MAIRTLAELKSRFQTTDRPDGGDFADLIDTLSSIGNINGSSILTGSVPINRLVPGSLLQKLQTNASGTTAEWANDEHTAFVVTQVSHGLAVADAVYVNTSGSFLKAQANLASTGQAVGVVGLVVSPDVFVLHVNGKITASTSDWDLRTGDLGGLASGTIYYLSDSTPAGFSTVAPTTVGTVVLPLLLAVSSTTALVLQQPSSIVGVNTISPSAVAKGWCNFDGRGTIISANITAVSTLNDTIDTGGTNPFGMIASVQLTGVDLPAPLVIATTYWLRANPTSYTNPAVVNYSIHTNKADALAGTNAIDLTTAGSGTRTITRTVKAYTTASFTTADVNTVTDEVTITAHPFASVQAVLVSGTGTLPAPLVASTVLYWAKSVDANTVAFFGSEQDASLDVNRIDLTTSGVTGPFTVDAGQTIRSSLNVDFVERLNQGVYRLWFRVPFVSDDYVVNMNTSVNLADGTANPDNQETIHRIDFLRPYDVQVTTGQTNNGINMEPRDSGNVLVTMYGNQ